MDEQNNTPTPAPLPLPFQLVNRAFNTLMFGGGLGFQYLTEADTPDAHLAKVAGNLKRLDESLRQIAARLEKSNDAQQRHALIIHGLGVLLEELGIDARQFGEHDQAKGDTTPPG